MKAKVKCWKIDLTTEANLLSFLKTPKDKRDGGFPVPLPPRRAKSKKGKGVK